MNTTLIRTSTETFTLVTDRWGDTESFDNSPESLLAAEKLTPFMASEFSFVVQKDGGYGLLIETEIEHKDSDGNVNEQNRSDEEIFQMILLNVAPSLAKYKGVEFWCEVGPHIFFNRMSFRTFIPEANLEALNESKSILRKMMDF